MRLSCRQLLRRGLLCMLFFAILISGHDVSAQETINKIFRGLITNSKGEPVQGASVTVKGTTNGTMTDDKGAFSIEAREGATIVVSSVGFQAQEAVLKGNGLVAVTLTESGARLDEVVVVGYGTQRKKDLTGAVATVDVTEAKKQSTNDITGLLQGRAPGVQVNVDGQPGAAPSVRIRGFSTFGGAAPFYVVDGVPVGTSIRDFSPNDIESISVLKDASSASIYGAAAANGVVIITTRQGRKNTAPKVEYNGYYGVDKVWQFQEVTNRQQYQMLNNEARANAGRPLFPANDPTNPGYVSNINTDWQKEGIKNGNRQNHNVSVYGGGANTTYNVALDYFDNNGTYVGNGPTYTRYTARVNTSAEKGIFKIGQTFNYTNSHENSLTFRDDILLGGIPPMVVSLVSAIPTMPVYDASALNGFGGSNSEFHGANSLNAIAVNNIFENWVDVDRTFGNVYGELQLIKNSAHNLRFRSSVSYDKTQTRDYAWQPAFYLGKFFSRDIARLDDNTRTFTNSAIENTFNYDLNLGKHSIQALLGQSYRKNSTLIREGRAEGFTMPYIPTLSNGQTSSARGFEYNATLSSYFGRVNYSFADRYLLSATLRRDGSSRFSKDNRYGYFPAASVGWKISSEDFWNVPRSAVSALKLRASYGKLGNDKIGDYQYQGTINTGVVYSFGGVRSVGGIQTFIASPGIKWEEKAISNFGFDGTFLNNRLDFSAEYYDAKSSDILVNVPIPYIGYVNSSPIANAATLRNKGFEFSATYHKTRGAFTFDVSANLSTVKNEVLSLGGNNEPIFGVGARTIVGGEIGEHYGFVYDGIFQNQAEINAHAKQFGAVLAPGDVRYKDISGPQGKPDGIVDEAFDRVALGSAIPKYNYGFNYSANYKNFDFSLFASGSAKFLINSRMYRDLHHSAGALNYSIDMLDRWTPTNTDTDIPRLNDADVNNGKDSNRPGWLQDGTFLRINTLSLGYTLPQNLIRGISKSRVYVTAQNLYTFQKYKGYNPDFTSGVLNPGFDFGSYPRPRTLMVGVQVGF